MSEFRISYLNEEKYHEWDQLVNDSEHGAVFYKSYWITAIFKNDPSIKFALIGCYRKDNLVAGLMIGYKMKFRRIKMIVPPYATSYYGILLKERASEIAHKSENFRHSLLKELLDFVETEFQILSFIFPPSFIDIRSFIWKKYSTQVLYSYRGRLSNIEEIFKQFSPDLRRRIKKGEELDYTIEKEFTKKNIEISYDLISTSFKNQNHAFNFNKKQYLDFLTTAELKVYFKIHTIWWKNMAVASVVLVMDGTVCYYWLAGGNQEYFKTNLNQVLMWSALKEVISEGYRIFDMVGANTPSISYYKSGFNFKLTPYYKVSRETTGLARYLMGIKRYLS